MDLVNNSTSVILNEFPTSLGLGQICFSLAKLLHKEKDKEEKDRVANFAGK